MYVQTKYIYEKKIPYVYTIRHIQTHMSKRKFCAAALFNIHKISIYAENERMAHKERLAAMMMIIVTWRQHFIWLFVRRRRRWRRCWAFTKFKDKCARVFRAGRVFCSILGEWDKFSLWTWQSFLNVFYMYIRNTKGCIYKYIYCLRGSGSRYIWCCIGGGYVYARGNIWIEQVANTNACVYTHAKAFEYMFWDSGDF